MSPVILRAINAADQTLLTGGESEFDDWGPRAKLESIPSCRLGDDHGALAIEYASGVAGHDPEVAGHVSWHYQQWGPGAASRNPELGIWMRPNYRGRGIGSAAQRQVAALFFAHTTVNRVQASTDVANVAEQRALERAGFQREGVIRASQWRAGAYHDMCLYAVVRGELAPADASTNGN